jgi:2-dehydropantoate 2-reductase
LAAAAPWLERLCTPATRVAVLQNGIDQVRSVAPLAGGATVLPVIVYYNGERLAPDHVRMRQGADQDVTVSDDETGRAFARLLEGTPLRVKLAADVATLLWRKLLINAVANPITALTLQRQQVLRRPDVQELCLTILDEAVTVGRADGAKLADDEPARALATLFTFSGELGTSMYFDRLAGRQLEVEALTGAIVAAGERHGIATPLNKALLTLLRAINDAVDKEQPVR